MKFIIKMMVGLLFAFSLTGCIGENFDGTVPTVEIQVGNKLTELKEAKIDWRSPTQYQLETKDIQSLAQDQQQVIVSPGQEAQLLFEHEDFDVKELKISVWVKDIEKKIDLIDNFTFYFPEEKGENVLDVNFERV
jgi:cytochrome c oxidase assembly protein Cox11